ncbi:hypothetical protein BH18THE2_BH18THE2_09310 [soil metagenome]
MSQQDNKDRRWYDVDIGGFVSEFGPFIIAMVVIAAFIYFTGITVSPDNPNAFNEVAGIWGVWVGSVIGYFFGSRQVEELSRRVNEVIEDMDINRDSYERRLKDSEETIDKLNKELDDLDDKYNDAVDKLQYVVVNHREHLGKDFLESLKNEHGVII